MESENKFECLQKEFNQIQNDIQEKLKIKNLNSKTAIKILGEQKQKSSRKLIENNNYSAIDLDTQMVYSEAYPLESRLLIP